METDIDAVIVELSGEKNREVVLEKIATLKIYVSILESMIEASKSKSQLTKIQSKLLYNGDTSHNRSDTQTLNWNTELCRNISQFTGMTCIKIKQNLNFIFEMSNAKDIARRNLYVIEILIDDEGHGKLGKCVLPEFVDVQNILSQYPINDLNNVKHFLKSCKQHIDCYFSRLKQIDELKKVFLIIKHTHVSYSFNINMIELVIRKIKDINTGKYYNVILWLYYNLDETRPYKLSSNTDEIEEPSSDLIRKLNKYFEPFLKMDLTSALLQINEFQNEFVWNMFWDMLMREDDNIKIYEDATNDENTGVMTQYLYRE